MGKRIFVFCVILLGTASFCHLFAADIKLSDSSSVKVIVDDNASALVKNAAKLLVREVKRRCPNAKWSITNKKAGARLQITFAPLTKGGKMPKDTFSIKVTGKSIEIQTSNPRAAIFAVGEILLKSSIYSKKIVIPELNITRKPYFPIRGFRDAGPMPFFKKGNFDKERFRGYMEDIALWGGNMFVEERNWVPATGVFDITDSVGLDLGLYFPSNSLGRVGRRINPKGPGNHKKLMDQFAQFANDYPHLELWSNATVDNGGWFSPDVMPWGKTHLELVEEEAAILRKKHPQLKVVVQYQLSHHIEKAELKAIKELVKDGKAKKWFNYFGPPVVNYPSFVSSYDFNFLIKAGIKPLYTDLYTHWDKQPFNKYGGIKLPYDTNLWNRGLLLRSMWGRRGGPAMMPRRLKGMIQQLAKWGGGGAVPYNHGSLHDDTSKYYSLRLLWDPEADLKVLSEDFGRLYFGPEAAPYVAEALLLMETNWARPVPGNEDIPKVYDLIEKAYKLAPKSYLDWNWRLHSLRFRACVDNMMYIGAQTGPAIFEEAFHAEVMNADESEKDPAQTLRKGLSFLAKWEKTKIAPLLSLFDEILPISQASTEKVRELILWNPGAKASKTKINNMVSRTWVNRYKTMMQKALASRDKDIQLQVIANTINYEYAGKDGFYNYPNANSEAKRQNIKGMVDNSFDVALSTPALWNRRSWRLSQRISTGRLVDNKLHDMEQVLTYKGLKRGVQYRFKFTHLGGFQARIKKSTRVYLDGELFPVPNLNNKSPRQFIFDIPKEYTKDSKLVVRFITPPYQVWRTLTECWLYPVKGEKDHRIPIKLQDIENKTGSYEIKAEGWDL